MAGGPIAQWERGEGGGLIKPASPMDRIVCELLIECIGGEERMRGKAAELGSQNLVSGFEPYGGAPCRGVGLQPSQMRAGITHEWTGDLN